jgi:hypothetical protein
VGHRYVEAVGGPDALMAVAQRAFDAGDFRWVGAASLGVLAARSEHQLGSERSHLSQAQTDAGPLSQVLSAPDVRAATATGTDGVGTATVVVSTKLDAGVLGVSGMPRRPAGRSYQVWLVGSGGPSSAGLLGSVGTRSPFLLPTLPS